MKKLIMGIVAVLLVAALAVPAFAATLSDNQKKNIDGLYNQIAGLRKQIVQKYVDSGVLTKDQGNQIKQNIDNSAKIQEENDAVTPGIGYNCGGYGNGYGMMSGYGGYGMMGGYYNNGGENSGNTGNTDNTGNTGDTGNTGYTGGISAQAVPTI